METNAPTFSAGPLAGRRFLVVEDEIFIAYHYEQLIEDAGGEAVAVVHTLASALEALGDRTFDAALLDIDLRGETTFPLANALMIRGIPFAFVSARYRGEELVGPYAKVPFLAKPVSATRLVRLLHDLVDKT
jgi:CheY-like chemotaxis protein